MLVCAIALCVLASSAAAQTAKPKQRKLPPDYRIKLAPALKGEVGKPLVLSLTIAPQPGYAISKAGPVRIGLSVKPKKGLALKRRRYWRKHAADKRADNPRFDLRLLAGNPGSYQLHVAVRFWVCGKHTCRPVRDVRRVNVTATPAVPASPPPATQPGAVPATQPG